ncbi:MAG: hypothetical protein JWO72_497 [Caulobacteraceae bacterium]|jgi:hypothetical protein|nr:hypothetical protein [Caulobacteraceae bacterium]
MRAAIAFGVCISAMLATHPAFAQATSTTEVSADISAPASISVVDNLNFNFSPQALGSGLTITSSAANGVNARILVGGALGSAVSVSVPTSIDVVNASGGQVVTVRTVSSATGGGGNTAPAASSAGIAGTDGAGAPTGGMFNAPVQVVGVLDNDMMSFSVGGAVTNANNLVPGEYHGVLTVIAQYN